jgi:hypothetical protein
MRRRDAAIALSLVTPISDDKAITATPTMITHMNPIYARDVDNITSLSKVQVLPFSPLSTSSMDSEPYDTYLTRRRSTSHDDDDDDDGHGDRYDLFLRHSFHESSFEETLASSSLSSSSSSSSMAISFRSSDMPYGISMPNA